MQTPYDFEAELEAFLDTHSQEQAEQFALVLNTHLDAQRGPAVLDAAAAERYADLAVAAHRCVGAAAPVFPLLHAPVRKALADLQTGLERALIDVAARIKDNPRYQKKRR